MSPNPPSDSSSASSSLQPARTLYIGLMSGTSLDGIDGALAMFAAPGQEGEPGAMQTLATTFMDFPAALRADLLALQAAGENEIEKEALAANALAHVYAGCVKDLLERSGVDATAVSAIGVHGQTIRHVPLQGFTRQTNNPALLAELTGIDVIAEFRHRDIAAGGQGAPLVPAFHHWLFGLAGQRRVVLNLGGIANITVLQGLQLTMKKNRDDAPGSTPSDTASGSAGMGEMVLGFDTGPANVLMDGWIATHLGQQYDANGAWAASGTVHAALLQRLGAEPYFALPAPKSTGRDLFNAGWLSAILADFPGIAPVDVQATLAALTANTVADAIVQTAADATAVYTCGGGAMNGHLMALLQQALLMRKSNATVESTEKLGVAPNHVEALAFAWLAQRFTLRQPGNLPQVTGASGPRVLGALYPA